MAQLDPAGQRTLEVLASIKPDAFAEVAPATGQDRQGILRLTVDAARRVVRAEVLDPDRVRDPDVFRAALGEAFFVADADRLYAALQRNGKAEEWVARAEQSLADPARLDVRRPDPRRITREGARARRAERAPRPARPAPGTSDNGFLTVQRTARGDLASIEVDAAWLSGAQAHRVEDAIVQATRYSLGD
ncbi:MAG TPA: hypothetical protein VNS81_03605 [Nocardioides sp.]|nr:hypothetical protein [Nocardioides sp.]